MIDWIDIRLQIEANTGILLDIRYLSRASGGSINDCYLLGGDEQRVFVKTNRRPFFYMFKAEAEGLAALQIAECIHVPEVLCVGISGEHAYIALQAIDLCSNCVTANSYRKFGIQLAALHRLHKNCFGAGRSNTIGSTLQTNKSTHSWVTFWRVQRLEFQLGLARENGAPATLLDDGFRLADLSVALFDTPPDSSCLHGDLWQGNWGFDRSGNVVIFDPAHYYGDRETDLAMTRLFGQAPEDFYAAYQEAYPLASGHSVRTTFYNIYHILNHYNLFGGSYANRAHQMILSVLSEIR